MAQETDRLLDGVGRYLPEAVRRSVLALPRETETKVEEIRLRAERPLGVTGVMGEPFLTARGLPTQDPTQALLVHREEIESTLERMAGFSVYALEEELRQGFLTLPGGHRVGIVGHTVLENRRVRLIKQVGGLDIRIARAVPGSALAILPYLLDGHGSLCSTLVVSPPRAGKTTLLRELIRLVSAGVPSLGLIGASVGVADERSELGAVDHGVPTLDLGPRTDILDGCPKAEGLLMLIRAMGPRVLATDELGRSEEAEALLEAVSAGVRLMATVHGTSLKDVKRRPGLRPLWEGGVFERAVLLSRRKGPGSVECVEDGEGRTLLGRGGEAA